MTFNKRLFIMVALLFIFAFCCHRAYAQTGTISATLVDTNALVLANSSYRIEYIKPFNNGTAPVRTDTGLSFTLVYSGTADASGVFTQAGVTRTDYIAPAGGNWKVTICPVSDSGCFYYQTTLVTGGTLNLSSNLTTAAGATSVTVGNDQFKLFPRAYQSSQLSGQVVGTWYFDINTSNPCFWNGLTWICPLLDSSNPNFCKVDRIVFYYTGCFASLNLAYTATPNDGILFIPDNTTAVSTGTITPKNSRIIGANRNTSIIRAGGAYRLFDGTSTIVKNFGLEHLTVDGNNTGTNGLFVPDYSGGVTDWSNGQHTFNDVLIKNFTNVGISLGRSVYMVTLNNIDVTNNNGDFFFDRYTEVHMKNIYSHAARNGHTNPSFKAVASSNSSMEDATFINNGVDSVEDILFATPADGNDGFWYLMHLKLGPENEVAGRVKLRINGSTSRTFYNLSVTGSDFNCGTSAGTAIKIDSPLSNSSFINNDFIECTTIINDNQGYFASNILGHNKFKNNRYITDNRVSPILFTNGGFGFDDVDDFTAGTYKNQLYQATHIEKLEIRNRIISNNLGAWTNNGPVTLTSGQVDPWGGTTGYTLTTVGVDSESLYTPIDMTGARTYLHGACYFKSGTIAKATLGIYDVTDAKFHTISQNYNLMADWDFYPIEANKINTGHAYRIYIYPNFGGTTAGLTMGFGGCRVNDDNGDFVIAAAATSTVGTGHNFITKSNLVGGMTVGDINSPVSKIMTRTDTQDWGSIAGNSCSETGDIAWAGLADGDDLVSTAPAAVVSADGALIYSARIASAGNFRLKVCNFGTGASANPPSGSFRTTIIKH